MLLLYLNPTITVEQRFTMRYGGTLRSDFIVSVTIPVFDTEKLSGRMTYSAGDYPSEYSGWMRIGL